jgi:NADH dehydrogenase FAD-containing subunit
MRRLILAGAGHAHARVLLELALRPVTDVELILVSPVEQAPYSGMVPGWMAGHYRWEECCVDFARLCKRAGARLYVASLTAIDVTRSQVVLDDAERLSYDLLSLDIGSPCSLLQASNSISFPCVRWRH